MLAKLFLCCVFSAVILLIDETEAFDSPHLLDPSYTMYPPVIRNWKQGIGINPIRRYYFVVDADFSGILIPRDYFDESGIGSEKCNTIDILYDQIYIDLGGPKPFFILGCSYIASNIGVLGLGHNSSLWGTFSGYKNKGGTIELLTSEFKSSQNIITSSPPPPLHTNSFIYDARNNKYTNVESYVARESSPTAIITFSMIYLFIYMRSKVVRIMISITDESLLSRIGRALLGAFIMITFPIILEFYGGRELLRQDVGLTKSSIIAALGYYSILLLIIYHIMRVVNYISSSINDETTKRGSSSSSSSRRRMNGWTITMELMGQLATSTSSLLAAWFCLISRTQADSGKFMLSSILVIIFYEQSVVIVLSIARIASNTKASDPFWWLIIWWILILFPIYGTTMWLTGEFAIFPFIEDKIVVGTFFLRAASFALQALIIYLAVFHIRNGLKYTLKNMKQKRAVRK